MPSRTSARSVASGAAVGAIALSLAFGGAAFADDIPSHADTASAVPAENPVPPTEPSVEPAPAPEPAGSPVLSAEADIASSPAASPAPDAAPPVAAAVQSPAEAIEGPFVSAAEPADTTRPTAQISAPQLPASGWYADAVDLQLSGADEGTGVVAYEYEVKGETRRVDGASATVAISLDGDYYVSVRAIDGAGNVSTDKTWHARIDTTDPYLMAWTPSSGRTVHRGDVLAPEFICADATSGVKSCTDEARDSEGRLDTSEVGLFEFPITMVDRAGNESTQMYRYTVTDDTTAPEARVELRGERTGDWFTNRGQVVLTAVDPLGGIRWTTLVDGEYLYQPDEVGVVYVDDEGPHTIEWRVQDAAGNVTDWQTLEVGLDSVAPTVQFAATDEAGAPIPSGATVARGSTLELDFQCTDAASGIADCSGDVVSGAPLDTTTPGSRSVLVTTTDNAGHESSARFEYTVDEAPDPDSPVPPTEPGQPGPTQPETAGPHTAAVAGEHRLASTGAADAVGIVAGTVALLTAGFTLTAVSRARRADR